MRGKTQSVGATCYVVGQGVKVARILLDDSCSEWDHRQCSNFVSFFSSTLQFIRNLVE